MARIPADRRHRDVYYSGKLNQFNDLWQQLCGLDEDVQQAAQPTRNDTLHVSDYFSRVVSL